jgi:hypothetical protein
VTAQLAEYQADLLSRDIKVLADLIYLRLCPAVVDVVRHDVDGNPRADENRRPALPLGSTSTPGTLDQSIVFFGHHRSMIQLFFWRPLGLGSYRLAADICRSTG